ncbi:hypothetical protein GM661_07295 [Iocasia frigidifontis]|uniref:Uncharacterized protein n=1 Tax=Iocasia fonsfrigidae TaxID=2682810 RepID=A0A8A7KCJ0_9FIRM|nr:hypothetical protein [Iocasia fonsfrigidae]QTL97805.1 hypothetical protein GM661_07295 [Iocasia fonsfrigidae]
MSVASAPSIADQFQHLKVTIGNSTIEVPKGIDPTTFETIVRILKDQC